VRSEGNSVPSNKGIGKISKYEITMNKKVKLVFYTLPLLTVASLVAFTGCSGVKSTAENERVTMSLLTNTEQDFEKPDNARCHPGQPYNQGWWPDK
jgi:hypothetical protein